jgi:hypothetical protein
MFRRLKPESCSFFDNVQVPGAKVAQVLRDSAPGAPSDAPGTVEMSGYR